MKNKKILFCIFVFIFFTVFGASLVNINYNNTSERTIDASIFINEDEKNISYSDVLYFEVPIYKSKGIYFKVFASLSPLDFRLNLGKYVAYINDNTIKNYSNFVNNSVNNTLNFFKAFYIKVNGLFK